MLKHIMKFVTASVLALVLGSAADAQPCYQSLWGLNEVYSNVDGSVQFLLLQSATSDGVAGRLAGQTIVASNGSTEHSFTFATPLPETSRPVLVGTQGFADLNLVKPDFVVPNGFVFVRNGSVRLRDSAWYCAQDVHYDALAADGLTALYPDTWGDGETFTADAMAINNAGESYQFSAKLGGLWWNAPAGSEPGWGIAIDNQRDIVFAAWATHDVDGLPVWFVMPRAERLGPFGFDASTYEGAIYRTTGPALGALPFDPSAVKATQVGFGHFQFASATDGTFSYTIGSALSAPFVLAGASKSITRQVFADPVSVCNEVGPPGPTPNFQGLWWNPAESGWGLHLTQQGDIIVAVWFTYDAAGKATWFVMSNASQTAPNAYAGPIYRTTGPAYSAASFDPAAVTETQVGTATLTFSDRNNGAFSYVVDGVAQTKNITRQVFADPPTVCN